MKQNKPVVSEVGELSEDDESGRGLITYGPGKLLIFGLFRVVDLLNHLMQKIDTLIT